jgi:hypothetical protein
MNIPKGAIFLFLVLASCQAGFGKDDETNVIAIGEWSHPSAGEQQSAASAALRGRLLIRQGHSPAYTGVLPETQVYLEVQNVSESTGGPLSLYFDPRNGLRAEMLDINGKPAPEVGGGGNGGFPSACWITLPYDSTLRLRVSWYGHGTSSRDGLKIPLFNELAIGVGDTNQCYLTATFTSTPPTNHTTTPGESIWQGRLVFPPVKVTALRR